MNRVPNPSLDRAILIHLTDKYKLNQKREGIHLSTLIYCLTRSFLDQSNMEVAPTDEEVMLFALGIGIQSELTPSSASAPMYQFEGIYYSPDMVFSLNGDTVELKTTRSGAKRYVEGNYPETWIEYIKGGCYILNKTEYNLSVLYLAERPVPKLISETLVFEREELEANWSYMIKRKEIYSEALKTNIVPTPYMYCKEWECKNCRHSTICSALSIKD